MKDKIVSQIGYYIGDPCYALRDDLYQLMCDKYLSKGGMYDENFGVYGTAYGDGQYEWELDTNGLDTLASSPEIIHVDSGTIGIIPLELVKSEEMDFIKEMGVVVPVEDGAETWGEIYDNDGTIEAIVCAGRPDGIIGELRIEVLTAPEREEEEEYFTSWVAQ